MNLIIINILYRAIFYSPMSLYKVIRKNNLILKSIFRGFTLSRCSLLNPYCLQSERHIELSNYHQFTHWKQILCKIFAKINTGTCTGDKAV